jgi:hypothetical protein
MHAKADCSKNNINSDFSSPYMYISVRRTSIETAHNFLLVGHVLAANWTLSSAIRGHVRDG